MTEKADAIIIGAGHNGLVCAAYLARAGMKVLCLESTGSAGGMCAPRKIHDGYVFPGLAHVGYPLNSAICRDLGLEKAGYAPGQPVDTIALDAGGNHLRIGANGVSGEGLPASDASSYPQFRQQYLAYAKAMQPLFENRPPRLKNMAFADQTTLAKLGWNIRMGLGRDAMYEFLRVAAINIYDVLDEEFADERLKAAIAVDAVMGSAMGPRTPGTVLTWLQRLYGELNGPLSVQSGGRTHLVPALLKSAEDAGTTVHFHAHVQKIIVENGATTGVKLWNGKTIESNVVISGADPRATFTSLVGAPDLDAMFASRVSQIRGSGVVAKLHLGLSGLPKFAGLDESQLNNRLVAAPSMRYIERAFNHSKYGEYSADPVLEITVPSLNNDALAPPGHHVMSINVAYVPYEVVGGWEKQRQKITDTVMSRLSQYAPGIASLVVDQELLTPLDIEEQFHAVRGHWHHGELSIHQSFMMRPVHGAAQYDTPIDGLFLCGAGCHPGGGISGLSGRNAARRVLELGRAT